MPPKYPKTRWRFSAGTASLITAIGVSLFLEYGGQIVFGASPRVFPDVLMNRVLIDLGIVQQILDVMVNFRYPVSFCKLGDAVSRGGDGNH